MSNSGDSADEERRRCRTFADGREVEGGYQPFADCSAAFGRRTRSQESQESETLTFSISRDVNAGELASPVPCACAGSSAAVREYQEAI